MIFYYILYYIIYFYYIILYDIILIIYVHDIIVDQKVHYKGRQGSNMRPRRFFFLGGGGRKIHCLSNGDIVIYRLQVHLQYTCNINLILTMKYT